jgi:hypothetical protein
MGRHGLLLVIVLLLCGAVPGCAPSRGEALAPVGDLTLTIESAEDDASQVWVELTGKDTAVVRRYLGSDAPPGKTEEVFFLTVRSASAKSSQDPIPVLARLRWSDRGAVLSPQTSLTPGLSYIAVFNGPRLSPSLPHLTREYAVPRDTRPSDARITAVYPRPGDVPANLLKFYVHFSHPMAQGRVFEHARLLDAGGNPVEQAFREVELWSEDHHRLTLWINPGRTKRALGLSESLGPVLEEQRQYTLEILSGLPDQRGRPVPAAYRYSFRTTGHDRDQPRIESWRMEVPTAGTRAPLVARFPEPMDHALAQRLIRIESAPGQEVQGRVRLDDDCRRWSFTPESEWTSGEYYLVAGGELEDLAGNSLYRPFETPAGKGEKPTPEPPEFRREFVISPGE